MEAPYDPQDPHDPDLHDLQDPLPDISIDIEGSDLVELHTTNIVMEFWMTK